MPRVSCILAGRAFDHAEMGRAAVARSLALKALSLEPRSVAAAHALAHASFEARDIAGGAAFLVRFLEECPVQTPNRAHLACHLAQFHLWLGRREAALDVWRRWLDPAVAPRVRLRDAAAILWRLRLAGLPELPWPALAPLARCVAQKPNCALDAVHAAMALASTNDREGMTDLLRALRVSAAASPSGEVTSTVVHAVAAFADGRHAEVVRALAPVMADLRCLGGSNAQRQVFEEMLRRSRAALGPAETETRRRRYRSLTARPCPTTRRLTRAASPIRGGRATARAAARRWRSATAATACGPSVRAAVGRTTRRMRSALRF